ncbi:MAG: sugar phosphate isomerase/epimerase [Clostridia bacterium]|nr:sugar phosphate isomerase/epimerase [Clostridia bacterium]
MFKLKPSVTLSYFGIERFNDGGYQIIRKDKEFYANLEEILNCGFEALELETSAPWNKQEEIKNYPFIKDVAKNVLKSGILFNSVHLPFSLSWWDFASPIETERKGAVESFKRAVDAYGEFLPNVFVIHPGIKPQTEEEREKRLNQLAKSMSEICEFSPKTVCIENMVNDGLLNKISEAKWLLNAVPKLNMTIDINHSFLQKPEDYILEIGSRVKNLHISDNDGLKEQHWLPKKGVINFNAVLSALEKTGYNQTFNYELKFEKNELSYKDVFNNYLELFNEYNKLK